MFYNQKAAAITDIGQRVGGAVRDVGEVYVKYQDHKEISAGAANGAQVIEGINKQWEDTAKGADPNDPAVAAKFREETLEPTLEKFRSGFTTERSQAWAEHFVDQYRQHMFHKTSADMLSLAADAVHTNALTTANSLGNTVYNDPSSLDFARNASRTALGGLTDSSPNLTAVQAAKVKTDLGFQMEKHLVNSAIQGAIAKGGDWKRIADDPKNSPYIDQAALDKYVREDKRQKLADLHTQKTLEDFQRKQNVRQGEDELSRLKANSISYDENGIATVKPNIYKDSLAIERKYGLHEIGDKADTYRRYAESVSRQKRESIVTDPVTHKQLYDGLFDPNPGTQTNDVKILDARARGKIDDHATKSLLDLQRALEQAPLKGPLYQGTMEAAKGILGANVMVDGHERYANFLHTFIPAYLRMTPEQRVGALNTSDENSLISKSMKDFRPTPTALMQAHLLRRLGGAIPGDTGVPPEPLKPDAAKRPVPPAAVQMLKNNPSMRGDFDAKYGVGSAAKILGQ